MAVAPDNLTIEPMLDGDVDAVARIDRRSFPSPWLKEAYHTELSNRSATYLVARLNGEVVGYGGQWVVGDQAHITTVAVDPYVQRRKIGARLVLALMEHAIRMGASHCSLEVREGNAAAKALYRKFAFRDQAIRKNYYTDNGEDAVVMWADDIHTPQYEAVLAGIREQICHRQDDVPAAPPMCPRA